MPTKTNDIRKVLTPTPLYFAAGVIDKLRETAPERLAAVREKAADPKAVQERLAQQAKQTQTKLTSALSGFDTDLRKLREQAQHLALQGVGLAAEYAVKAREGYGELAERGRGAVQTWRGEKNGGDEGGKTGWKAAGRAPLTSRHRGEAVVVEAGDTEEKPRPKMGGTRQGTAARKTTARSRTTQAGTAKKATARKTTTARKSTAGAPGTAKKTAAAPTPKAVAKKETAAKKAARQTPKQEAAGQETPKQEKSES
ncbi:hypothetical protein GCM10010420_08180 [Streptomyces glaucosporus]|uniref:Uncharacterized protein n=1 Tax=Streptomyces glaucosporus TaxID=284044 RepID=A0ABN3HT98_9ACTN